MNGLHDHCFWCDVQGRAGQSCGVAEYIDLKCVQFWKWGKGGTCSSWRLQVIKLSVGSMHV